MHSATCSASVSESDVCLLVNVSVMRVESLRIVVVKYSWLSVVLFRGHDDAANFTVGENSSLRLLTFGYFEPWHIFKGLLSGLLSIFLCLDTEWVLCLVSWVETPVCFKWLCLCFLICLWTFEIVLPSYTSTEIVPVEVSIGRNKEEEGPEHPSHLTNHPHVGLAHVVGNVEHHCIYYN